jgi:hypothetical protein
VEEEKTQLTGIHSDAVGKPNNPAHQRTQEPSVVARFTERPDQRQRFAELVATWNPSTESFEDTRTEFSVSLPIVFTKTPKMLRSRTGCFGAMTL